MCAFVILCVYTRFLHEIKYACFVLTQKVSDGAFAANLSPSSWHAFSLASYQFATHTHTLFNRYICQLYICHVSADLMRFYCIVCVYVVLLLREYSRLNFAFLFDSLEIFLLHSDSNGRNIKLHQTLVALFFRPIKLLDDSKCKSLFFFSFRLLLFFSLTHSTTFYRLLLYFSSIYFIRL